MSEVTIQDAKKPAAGGWSKAPAGRPEIGDATTLNRVCNAIRKHGLSDEAAALLAGITRDQLDAGRRQAPDCTYKLAKARAEFRRAILNKIREGASKDAKLDWRAFVWLWENASGDQVTASDSAAPLDPSEMRFDGQITLAHMLELQRRRRVELQADDQGEIA